MYTYMALDLELFPVLPVDLDILLYQNHQLPQPKPGLPNYLPNHNHPAHTGDLFPYYNPQNQKFKF